MQRSPLPFSLCLISLILLGLALPGCDQPEARSRIVGKVTFQGQPVPQGRVYFSNSATGVNMGAKLTQDGSYEVLTAQGAGLPLGTYAVSVTPPPPSFSANPSEAPNTGGSYPNIPQKYRTPKTSELMLEAGEGENRLDIDMQP